MEGLKECEANLMVYLHPSKTECVEEAILGELSSLLFTYNETFEGVVLAYDNLSSSTTLGKILPVLHPYFGVKLKARLFLFSPKPHMLLEGEVVKITRHSIHAVVLGFSSVFIADEDIRDEFKYKKKDEGEIYFSRSHKKHKIKVGAILCFLVKSFDEEMLHISGSLIADHTGCARWLGENSAKCSQADYSATSKTREVVDKDDKKLENDRVVNSGAPNSLKNDEKLKISKKRRIT